MTQYLRLKNLFYQSVKRYFYCMPIQCLQRSKSTISTGVQSKQDALTLPQSLHESYNIRILAGIGLIAGIDVFLLKKNQACYARHNQYTSNDLIETYTQGVLEQHALKTKKSTIDDDNHTISSLKEADFNWIKQKPQCDQMAIEHINGNITLEDRAVVQQIQTLSNGTMIFAAVIDGHGGWQVAEYVQKKIGSCVENEIHQLEKEHTPLTPTTIGEAMTNAFIHLDAHIMEKIKGPCEIGLSRTAKIGACCVASVISADWIIIANAGDCRAILGTESSTPEYLSLPHSANEKTEQLRLKREHPDELDIVICKKSFQIPAIPKRFIDYPIQWLGLLGNEVKQTACYVKGRLQPTRSFGDFYLKKKEFSFDFETNSAFIHNGNSFPYITAQPEIRILKRTHNKNDFLLLGSDGVWDFLTPVEVTHIVKQTMHNTVHDSAKSVIQAVLKKASEESGLTIGDISLLPPTQKRRIFDDTTVCIVQLDNLP